MGWMRVLAFIFNLFGVLFLLAAVGAFIFGAAVGGSAGSSSGDAATIGSFMGGMIGTFAAVGNFLASLGMFFFGAVLWALQRILAEIQRLQPAKA